MSSWDSAKLMRLGHFPLKAVNTDLPHPAVGCYQHICKFCNDCSISPCRQFSCSPLHIQMQTAGASTHYCPHLFFLWILMSHHLTSPIGCILHEKTAWVFTTIWKSFSTQLSVTELDICTVLWFFLFWLKVGAPSPSNFPIFCTRDELPGFSLWHGFLCYTVPAYSNGFSAWNKSSGVILEASLSIICSTADVHPQMGQAAPGKFSCPNLRTPLTAAVPPPNPYRS